MQVALPELDSAATINFHREISVDDFEGVCDMKVGNRRFSFFAA